MKNWKHWDASEIAFLKKNFKKMRYEDLAKAMKRSKYSVKGMIKILGLKQREAQKIFLNKEELSDLYNKHGKNCLAAAKELNVTRGAVLYLLKKYDIERRIWEARYIDKICIGCKKEFTIKYKQRNRIYCSKKCYFDNADYSHFSINHHLKNKNSAHFRDWKRKMIAGQKRRNLIPEKRLKLNKDFAFCLGAYYGDGWSIRRLRNYNVFLASIDDDFIEYYRNCFERWSGLNPHKRIRLYNYGKRKIYYTNIGSNELKHFVNFDLKKLYDAPKTVKAAFIKGIADSEGCMHGKKRGRGGTITIHNTDLKLIKLCKKLMFNLGIESKYYSRNAGGFKGHYYGRDIFSHKKQYIICIRRKENLIKFNNKIGFSIGRKQEKLDNVVKSYSLRD